MKSEPWVLPEPPTLVLMESFDIQLLRFLNLCQTSSFATMAPDQYARAAGVGRDANLLIFGTAIDALFWQSVARRVVIVEDRPAQSSVEGVERFHAAYWGCLGISLGVPDEILKQIEPLGADWDVILVDGPAGHSPGDPGREESIYAAAALRNTVGSAVLVHDYERPWERSCCDRFLGPPDEVQRSEVRNDNRVLAIWKSKRVLIGTSEAPSFPEVQLEAVATCRTIPGRRLRSLSHSDSVKQSTEDVLRVRILVIWYGPLPYWWNFFLVSCKGNKKINWLFVSDSKPKDWEGDNLDFLSLPLDQLWKLASDRLELNLDWKNYTSYKICDLRLGFGRVFEEHLVGFDWFAWSDIDVVYGNVGLHLERHLKATQGDVVSLFPNKISGFLSLIRNTEDCLHLHEGKRGFFRALLKPGYCGMDEVRVKEGIRGYAIDATDFFAHPYGGDQCWIDGSREWPDEWIWRFDENGPSLTTNLTGDREFIALHFMNWKGGPWARKNKQAQWERRIEEGLDVVHCNPSEAGNGFKVTSTGFHSLSQGLAHAESACEVPCNSEFPAA